MRYLRLNNKNNIHFLFYHLFKLILNDCAVISKTWLHIFSVIKKILLKSLPSLNLQTYNLSQKEKHLVLFTLKSNIEYEITEKAHLNT